MQATALYQRAVESDPVVESFHRGLLRGLLKRDQRADALRAYEQCRLTLEAELGAKPSPETQALVSGL